MLKGYQRKLIMMPTRDSTLYETAYFVMREDNTGREPSKTEMLSEATRILEAGAMTGGSKKYRKSHLLLALLLGFFIGLSSSLLLLLIKFL